MGKIWLYLSILLMIVYSISLILVLFYSLSQLNLLWNYVQYKKKKEKHPLLDLTKSESIPFITIQLPVFNELYVMERLLKCINQIEYPREKLEVQVLDDSTDESVELTRRLVEDLKIDGLDIVQIRRKNRVGLRQER